ncbi:MAG: hypothetical protein HC902_01320 [Calothrix sp. SM1_5_4]|nr:hypothetical protein [Calothrix sp. SM1_5_4]
MRRFIAWVGAIIFCVSLSSCKREDPNPELRDPIYKDLEARATEHQKTFEETKAKIEGLKSSLEKVEPNTSRNEILSGISKRPKTSPSKASSGPTTIGYAATAGRL